MRTKNKHVRRARGRTAAVFATAGSVIAVGIAAIATATSASAAPAPGSYTLKNAGSGLCLQVPGASTGTGVQLAQSSCTGTAGQTWTLAASGGGYTLTASHSGRCAGVRDASTSAGKPVEQQSCSGAASQVWKLTETGSGFQVVNGNGGKCLNVKDSSTASGALVQQNSCDSVKSKHWTFTPAGSTPPPTTPPPTTPPPTTPPPTNPGDRPAWPSANGQQAVGSTIAVSGTLDGGMKRYYGTGDLGDDGQSEDLPALFELADGATLQNVILGSPAADGVHCKGTCTLKNVWWEDVGEDAATFRGSSASLVRTIDGGGAKLASDKVFQHNGAGTLVVKNFQADDIGKLVRSCGNCSTQYGRHIQLQNIWLTAPADSLVGINTNYGDTARMSAVTVYDDAGRDIEICTKYKGTTSGEPSKIGSGPDSTNCLYRESDITYVD
ncbi:pectate lyase [Streptomyces genisteinicus]|uniref:pectate lyase n=1 Tax=Streptomyces genisteinicus TaxID=2768068 RepID=UPI0031B6207D